MSAPTPMLKQYQQIKAKHQNSILFFRLGDFYEMFYEDAKDAASILDLVLTSRGKGDNRIPMCGIPYHSSENYIAKLIKAGRKVAICEQVEDVSEAKGIVKRDVVRTITASTYLDDSSDARYLISLNPNGKSIGVAFTDTATGTIFTNQFTSPHQAIELLAKLPVAECIYPDSSEETIKDLINHPLLKLKNVSFSRYVDWSFSHDMAQKALCEHFATQNLRGFGIEDLSQAKGSCGALLEYLKEMNKQPLKHINRISLYKDDDYVFISPAANYGLELEELYKTLNGTLTPMGRRLFRFWLFHPLKDVAHITQRQAAVSRLKDEDHILENLGSDLLRHVPDLEKSLSRLSSGCSSPRDILSIRNALLKAPEIKAILNDVSKDNSLLVLDDLGELRKLLERAINPEMPLTKNEGKVIREGYNEKLDDLRNIQENGREWLRDFQAREAKRTGINSLKVGFNKVFGYYIEISKANAHLAPEEYIRKQTLVNGERYIVEELKDYEDKILTAQDRILSIEARLLKEIHEKILGFVDELHQFAHQIATIDVLYSLSVLANQPNYIRPKIDDSLTFDIKDGRHPVVEQMTEGDFVANDTLLDCDANHLIILTGPNMSGKSTYIRQTAILVIMAQMGSFIPASNATIGVVDKVFTRIGAHDEIAKGQSTFMVEMTETADILNNLSDRSLIILDEIGRGTSTFDGLSLAWALAEYLNEKKVRTMFATHFHELTSLAQKFDGIKNYNVAVKEWQDKIIFMHKIIPGGTDDSYGIYVAKLAGLPDEVISRAKNILGKLELNVGAQRAVPVQNCNEHQMDLFSVGANNNSPLQNQSDPIGEELKDLLKDIDINALTPVDALNKLNELRNKVKINN